MGYGLVSNVMIMGSTGSRTAKTEHMVCVCADLSSYTESCTGSISLLKLILNLVHIDLTLYLIFGGAGFSKSM